MDIEYLHKQYDRLLSQVKEEARDLYWLYNFFFLIESAIIASLLSGKILPEYLFSVKISGLFLAVYWFMIVHKQRLWRNNLIKRIQKIEKVLGYDGDFRIWPPKRQSPKLVKDYIFGRRGLWRFMFLLPIGFGLFWIILIL